MASETKRKKEKKKIKEEIRKGGLNQKEKKKKKSSWNPEKAFWPRKEVPRLKTWKGGLGQWKLTGARKEQDFCDNQDSLVRGKTEAEICFEGTKDPS